MELTEFKIAGACTLCDQPCFEVIQTQAPSLEQKKLGLPLLGAMRFTFLLMDGSMMDLTFCAQCGEALAPSSYVAIWRKVMRSWLKEIGEEKQKHSSWFTPQFANGILCVLARRPWSEAIAVG